MRRFVCCLLISFAAPVASAQRYAITDLGAFSPTAINTQGHIAGNLDGHAYIWTFQGLQNLGALTGGKASSAATINDAGEVAGMADGPAAVYGVGAAYGLEQNCSDVNQAFVWTKAKGMQGLGTVGIDANEWGDWCQIISYAAGINLAGVAVGTNDFVDDTYDWAFFSNTAGGITLLPMDAWAQLAYAINKPGDVVGMLSQNTTVPTVSGHAALWSSDTSSGKDLGSLGGPGSFWLLLL